uniref:Uncharacterized protein n=1 Tax=Ciona savignyi TaxID=51511 RepID=H2ZLP6_CIOSA
MLCCSAVISNHLVASKSPILSSPLSHRRNPTNSIVQKTSSPSTSPRIGPHPKARSRLSLTPRRSDLEIIKVRKEAASLREENNFLRKQLQELKTKNSKTGKFRKQRLTFDNKTSLGNDSTDTVISQLRLKLRESEKNNQLKLEEQRSALNKQLKQASELVRICLGKVKEAEETAKKVPALEMELIVLRRQLATDRSERRFSSMSSSASCDTGFKSGSDYDLDQSHHCKSRSDLSCSSSQSDLEENTKETYNDSPVAVSAKEANMRLLSSDEPMGRLSYYEDETMLPRLEKLKSCSPAKLPERNSDMNMSMFENLLKEHQKALDIIGALERKFCEQHNEMRTLKDNVDTISSTQQFTKPDNQQQDASLFRTLHSIQYKNLSYEEMGMIVFKALSLAEENHVLDYKKFSSNMIEVSKQNDVSNQL